MKSKRDNSKFSGRNGEGDEMLELSIGIMQGNAGQLVDNERLVSLLPGGPGSQATKR